MPAETPEDAGRAAERVARESFGRLVAFLAARTRDVAAVSEASATGPSGRYQLEAAIQSAHVARRLGGAATWPAIVALYDHLLVLTGSPVVALNRGVALAEMEGPGAALAALDRPRAAQEA